LRLNYTTFESVAPAMSELDRLTHDRSGRRNKTIIRDRQITFKNFHWVLKNFLRYESPNADSAQQYY